MVNQAGCFSGFGFKKVLGRKNKKTNGNDHADEPETITPTYGEGDWSLEPREALPSYTTACSGRLQEKFPSTLSPELIQSIESKLDELDSELRKLSLKIHAHPELAFKEYYAHDTLAEFMETHGFTVTRHYAKLDTAWRAEYTHPGSSSIDNTQRIKRIPVLGVNSEMDALPGIGHGCGHNLIAICGVGIAIAVKHALEKHDVVGKVVLLGTPAEEQGGGKAILLKRDAYKEMDVCLMSHPMPGPANSAVIMGSNAMNSVTVEYFGKTAHAGAAPWEGKNALDAAVIAYAAISTLRQQFQPVIRVHGIIEGRDWVPNVIPGYAKLRYIVRAPTMEVVKDTYERVKGCFEAAAVATGCEVKIDKTDQYYDLRQNSVLANEFTGQVASRYGTQILLGDFTGASTDFARQRLLRVAISTPRFYYSYRTEWWKPYHWFHKISRDL